MESQFIEISIDKHEEPVLEDKDSQSNVHRVYESIQRFIFKDSVHKKQGPISYLYYPTFTILVTLAEFGLLVWVCSFGFVNPAINPMLGPSAQSLLDAGGKWTPYIIERSEWWRLISAMFLHAGIIHFISNLIAQLFICSALEIKYGTHVIGIVYILTGISGNVWSAIFTPGFVTVGASGALFGMFGMWTVEIFKYFRLLHYPWGTLFGMLLSMVISFALGILPYVDNYAHLGGYIPGVLLGMLFIPNPRATSKFRRYSGFALRITGGILFLAVFIGTFCVLYLVQEPVSSWCPGCSYFNCIPRIVNGVNWCEGF